MTRPKEPDAVHAEVGDVDVYLPDGQQYPLPELSGPQIAELEARTAEQVATVRDEQSLKIANLGLDGAAAHFLVTRDGGEYCGGDGEAWPCRVWTEEIQPAAVQASADVPAAVTYSPAEIAMADELGITAAELRERVRAR